MSFQSNSKISDKSIKEESGIQAITVLIASVTFCVTAITGICAIGMVVLWYIDGVLPTGAVRWVLGGIPVSAFLIALTMFLEKREPKRNIFGVADKLSPRCRLIIQIIFATVAFAILQAEWTFVVQSVFWSSCIVSFFLISPKIRSERGSYNLSTAVGVISCAQFIAFFILIQIVTDLMPKGWVQSVAHRPPALFACWVLTVLQYVSWYLKTKNEDSL